MKVSDCMRVFEGFITDVQGLFDKDVREAQLLNIGNQSNSKQEFLDLDDEPVIPLEIKRLSPTTTCVNGSRFYGTEKSMNWFLEDLK